MVRDIIWDLDGTLVNSEPEIIYHLIRAIEAIGIKAELKKSELRIGPPLASIIKESYGDVSSEQVEAVTREFRNNYDNCGFKDTYLFDGILEVLSIRGLRHHIVTNKPQFATSKLIDKLSIAPLFASIRSTYFVDGVAISKSYLFKEVIDEFGLDTNSVVGIGDMVGDARGAIANGLRSYGVTWGTGIIDELKPVCNKVFNSVQELHNELYQESLC